MIPASCYKYVNYYQDIDNSYNVKENKKGEKIGGTGYLMSKEKRIKARKKRK